MKNDKVLVIGLISEKAIKKFLYRELDNFDWMKDLSFSQINSALSELNFKEIDSLWLHQRTGLLLMQHHPRFIFHIGMGGGKSRLILESIKYRKLQGESPRAIVFVPYIAAIDTWLEEVKKFTPELKCIPLIGGSKENGASLNQDFDLCVICYASAIHIPYDLFSNFDTLILDEIQKCSNHRTKTFQLIKHISQQATYCYGLTGTPFGSSIEPLWAEFYVIDFGETLGPNISFFRNAFFKKKFKFHGGVEFKPIAKRMPHLKRMIKNKSIHYSVKELSDMPEKQYIKIRIPLPHSIQSHVEKAHKELQQAVIDQDVKLAGNSFLTLRQLSSGFITFKGDEVEDGKAERFKIRFDESPKLDTLVGLIEAMPQDCKMVVFHDYIETGHIISDRLTNLGIKHSAINGHTRDKLNQLQRFRTDADYSIMLLNSRSGSAALNLQFASYLVFFEGCSVIDRQQAEARCYRPGQSRTVFIYDLFMIGTIDEQYYNTVKEGGDLLKEFLTGKKNL